MSKSRKRNWSDEEDDDYERTAKRTAIQDRRNKRKIKDAIRSQELDLMSFSERD